MRADCECRSLCRPVNWRPTWGCVVLHYTFARAIGWRFFLCVLKAVWGFLRVPLIYYKSAEPPPQVTVVILDNLPIFPRRDTSDTFPGNEHNNLINNDISKNTLRVQRTPVVSPNRCLLDISRCVSLPRSARPETAICLEMDVREMRHTNGPTLLNCLFDCYVWSDLARRNGGDYLFMRR